MSRSCAIVQPNYIPWKGYFDLINCVDHFVLYDTVQYTKGDWRNRNQLKTSEGPKWLTLPVSKKAHRLDIAKVGVLNEPWKKKHPESWKTHYANSEHADEMLPEICQWYENCSHSSLLSICRYFIELIAQFLSIETPIHLASEFRMRNERNQRLIDICQSLGCTKYVSGPAAKNYLEVQAFEGAGIEVEWFDYSGYLEYPQPHPPFVHQISVLDLLLCTGLKAGNYLQRSASQESQKV